MPPLVCEALESSGIFLDGALERVADDGIGEAVATGLRFRADFDGACFGAGLAAFAGFDWGRDFAAGFFA